MTGGGPSVVLAVTVGVLYALGTYLLLQRSLTRIVLGLGLLGHGANLLLLLAGGRGGVPPFAGAAGRIADPLPQAMALTAIVITFGVTAFLLALAYRSFTQRDDDEVQDDLEDRRVAREADRELAAADERDALDSDDRDALGDGEQVP